jgi:hypothetical protein
MVAKKQINISKELILGYEIEGASEKCKNLPGHFFIPRSVYFCRLNVNLSRDSVPLTLLLSSSSG